MMCQLLMVYKTYLLEKFLCHDMPLRIPNTYASPDETRRFFVWHTTNVMTLSYTLSIEYYLTWLILPSLCTNCNRTKWGLKGGGFRVSGGLISDDYPSMCCIDGRMWGGGVSDNRSLSVQFRRRNAGSARVVAAAACVSPACVALQFSSTAGNLIGPELSPMRRSRPAVARRLSIRAPVPCPRAACEPDLVTPPLYTRDA